MAVNANTLINFGTSGLNVGDWTYSAVPLSAPTYLPLNKESATYLVSSYPALGALMTTAATTYAATARTAPASSVAWKEVAYGNGIFVAISGTTVAPIITSNDGYSWTLRDFWVGGGSGAGTTSATPIGIAFGNGLFVLTTTGANASSTGTQVFTSVDGITWNYIVIAATAMTNMWPIYVEGNWLLISSLANLYKSIDNGVTWIAFATGPGTQSWGKGRAYGLGRIVTGGTGTGTSAISSSPDGGRNWQTAITPAGTYGSIAFGNGRFIALNTSGTANNTAAFSTDGNTWTSKTLPSTSAWRSIAFGNGVFVALSSTGTAAATTIDGTTWTAVTLPSSLQWDALCFGGPTNNSYFVALAGNFGAITIAYGVSQTNFTLPLAPPMKNMIPYIKAT